MPGLQQVRAVTQVVGRRTALRYLAVGVVTSIVAACSKDRAGDNRTGPTSGTSTGPVGRAVSAFVTGRWRVDVSSQEGGPTPVVLLVDVTANRWTIKPYDQGAWEGGARWSGQWAHLDGKLTVQGPYSPYEPGLVQQAAALNVPATVGETESLQLPWQTADFPNGGQTTDSPNDKLKIKYAQGRLYLTHIDDEGIRTEYLCTRAEAG